MQKTYLHIKRKDDKNISINVLRNTIIIVILQTLIISSNSYLLEYYNFKNSIMSFGYTVNKEKNGVLLAYLAERIPNITLRKLLKLVYLTDEKFNIER